MIDAGAFRVAGAPGGVAAMACAAVCPMFPVSSPECKPRFRHKRGSGFLRKNFSYPVRRKPQPSLKRR